MNRRQFNEITEWQRETFGEATAISKLIHLGGEEPGGEIKELLLDIAHDNPNKRLEYADCFILLFGAAASDGMSYENILEAIEEKMLINYQRKWGKPDANGVVNHIK